MMDVINLLELELKGVTLKVFDYSGPKARKAGDYSFFSRTIRIRREISHHWFVTLTTLLHEYGHHRRKRLVLVVVVSLAALSFSWFSLTPRLFLSDSIFCAMIVGASLLFKEYYTEPDAERYTAAMLPGEICLILSQIEVFLVAESMNPNSKKRALRFLHELMKQHFCILMEPFERHKISTEET